MSLYLVSCEFSSGSEGYEKFNEQLGVLRAVQILNRTWLVKHTQGKAKKLRDFLNPYLDNGDRLLVQEVRHPPRSGWLSEWGRLKGGHPLVSSSR
jgi:hypothetical protein